MSNAADCLIFPLIFSVLAYSQLQATERNLAELINQSVSEAVRRLGRKALIITMAKVARRNLARVSRDCKKVSTLICFD